MLFWTRACRMAFHLSARSAARECDTYGSKVAEVYVEIRCQSCNFIRHRVFTPVINSDAQSFVDGSQLFAFGSFAAVAAHDTKVQSSEADNAVDLNFE